MGDSLVAPNPNYRSSNTPISSTTLSFCTMTISPNTKFTLLNDQGDALSGFYMEIQSFPGADRPGRASMWMLEAPRTKLNSSSTKKFSMTPVRVGNDIVGLDVQFSHINDFVAHFALDISEDEENVVYDILAPPVHLNELRSASF